MYMIIMQQFCETKYNIHKVQLSPDGRKPDRQMRSMSSSLKAELQGGKVQTIVEQYALKLPDRNSHQYHATEGEVSYTQKWWYVL